MRGHLEARGSGTWRTKVFLGQDANGRQRYLTRTIHGTKREADTQLRQLILEAGLAHDTTNATVGDLASKWLELAEQTLSPSTYREYRRLLEKIILPEFATVKVRALRPSDLDNFYVRLLRRGVNKGRPLSSQSVHHVHALIRRLFNQVVKWGWVLRNPATNATPPSVRKPELKILSVDTVNQIIEFAHDRNPEVGCFLRLAGTPSLAGASSCSANASVSTWRYRSGSELGAPASRSWGCPRASRLVPGARRGVLILASRAGSAVPSVLRPFAHSDSTTFLVFRVVEHADAHERTSHLRGIITIWK